MGSNSSNKSILIINITLVLILYFVGSIVCEGFSNNNNGNVNNGGKNISGLMMLQKDVNNNSRAYVYKCSSCTNGENYWEYTCTGCNYEYDYNYPYYYYYYGDDWEHPGVILGVVNSSIIVIVGFVTLCCFLGSCCCFRYRKQNVMGGGHIYAPPTQGIPVMMMQAAPGPSQQLPAYYQPTTVQQPGGYVQATAAVPRQPHLVVSGGAK